MARWWVDTEAWVRKGLLDDDPDTMPFAILELPARELIGYLQAGEETTPDYRHAAIDIFLTTDRQGKGFGVDAIRTAIAWLIDERGHHRITIDPAGDNLRAIRAYEKIGFRPVGLMRRYERGRDGTWHDGLLMDLLAEEFVQG